MNSLGGTKSKDRGTPIWFYSRKVFQNHYLWSPYLLIDFTVASSFHIPSPNRSIRKILMPGVRDAKNAPRRPEL